MMRVPYVIRDKHFWAKYIDALDLRLKVAWPYVFVSYWEDDDEFGWWDVTTA